MYTYPLRLLLIDDDEDDILLTQELIADQQQRVMSLEWVLSAAEGRDLLRRAEHDVYLIDYRLGAESGLDLVRELRESGSLAPLIVLTGQGDEEVGLAAIQSGADDYLVKGRLTTAALERSTRYAYERKRAERERIQLLQERAARAEAEAAISARDEFISLASHELKTPLTSILGNMQLLQRSLTRNASLSPREQRLLQVAAGQVRRLADLINTLLDISHISTGRLQILPAPLDVCAFVSRVIDETRAGLDHHQLHLAVPSEPLVIMADELRLEQVLQNLISNAVKYSPAGGPVEVLIIRHGDEVWLQVRDQGIGIPQAALAQVFERFYRAENAQAKHIRGMGVGLSVVHEIVTLHGGRIEAVSHEGAGSTFTVILPLATVAGTAPTSEYALEA